MGSLQIKLFNNLKIVSCDSGWDLSLGPSVLNSQSRPLSPYRESREAKTQGRVPYWMVQPQPKNEDFQELLRAEKRQERSLSWRMWKEDETAFFPPEP